MTGTEAATSTPQVAPPRSLMAMLKVGTADLHRQIEAVFPIVRPDLSLADYRDCLVRMYAFYVALEVNYVKFSPSIAQQISLEKRRKSHLLALDLRALGLDPEGIDTGRIRLELPTLLTPEDLIGTLYVIEGSTLGGQVVRRMLKTSLGLSDDQLHFFSAYGSETRAEWHEFGEVAEAMIAAVHFDRVLTAAQTMFVCMTQALKESG